MLGVYLSKELLSWFSHPKHELCSVWAMHANPINLVYEGSSSPDNISALAMNKPSITPLEAN